jgi:hypothetical protein
MPSSNTGFSWKANQWRDIGGPDNINDRTEHPVIEQIL